MVKFFCDHCDEEIDGIRNELDIGEIFYDIDTKTFVGRGTILCDKCYELREQKHIALDREFLRVPPKEG